PAARPRAACHFPAARPVGFAASAEGGVRNSHAIRPIIVLEAKLAVNGLRWSISWTSATRSTERSPSSPSCALAAGVNGPATRTGTASVASSALLRRNRRKRTVTPRCLQERTRSAKSNHLHERTVNDLPNGFQAVTDGSSNRRPHPARDRKSVG